MKINTKSIKTGIISMIAILVAVSIIWILVVRLEGEKPAVDIVFSSDFLGASQKLSFTVSDAKSGLRRIWVGIIQSGKELVLLEKDFPGSGFIAGGDIRQEAFTIPFEPKKRGIVDGKTSFRIAVWDYSWRGRFNGNSTIYEKEVVIDTQPPSIDVQTRAHNVAQGGAGLIIYKLSEPCPETGVFVGESFYPGYSGYFKDKEIFLSFFALDYRFDPKSRLFVYAVDAAGNQRKTGFYHYIKRKNFKKDIINISDRFLSSKMPEFENMLQQTGDASPVQTFLKVNRNLRESNYRRVVALVQKPEKTIHWSDRFLRLPKSARRSSFADHREYRYQGKEIDQQVHLGIDLAALAHSPVPAANTGKVIFSDDLGIYGKTIIIDHGFGLFSMYSHLSELSIPSGHMISKGDIIGRTGSTGLAGGDHLHFSMLVHDTFVNPIEWWDSAWIENNVLSKIRDIQSR